VTQVLTPEIETKVKVRNRGWQVTLAGLGINLSLGVLYTWSVISSKVPEAWGWSEADRSWPYSIACLVFSLIMVPAGRLQDRFGPRLVATAGGILLGIGLILASFSQAPLGWMIGFGLLGGAGIGFAYASATPPAVKWFPAAKTGMVAGIVVSGFGLASVYAAPLARWLIDRFGLPTMALTMGIGALVVVTGLSQLLIAPPSGYIPPQNPGKGKAGGFTRRTSSATRASRVASAAPEVPPSQMLKTPTFYMLWFMYACGAGAGLMIIAKLAAIGKLQAGLDLGFVLVAALAIGNGGGRILAGTLSDRFGRRETLLACFLLQGLLIFLLSTVTEGSWLANTVALSILSALIGANYGANLSLFPALTKDLYGLKNFGTNYGLVFTAWGVGGFMLALLAGKLYDIYHSFAVAFYGAIALLVAAAVCTVLLPKSSPQTAM